MIQLIYMILFLTNFLPFSDDRMYLETNYDIDIESIFSFRDLFGSISMPIIKNLPCLKILKISKEIEEFLNNIPLISILLDSKQFTNLNQFFVEIATQENLKKLIYLAFYKKNLFDNLNNDILHCNILQYVLEKIVNKIFNETTNQKNRIQLCVQFYNLLLINAFWIVKKIKEKQEIIITDNQQNNYNPDEQLVQQLVTKLQSIFLVEVLKCYKEGMPSQIALKNLYNIIDELKFTEQQIAYINLIIHYYNEHPIYNFEHVPIMIGSSQVNQNQNNQIQLQSEIMIGSSQVNQNQNNQIQLQPEKQNDQIQSQLEVDKKQKNLYILNIINKDIVDLLPFQLLEKMLYVSGDYNIDKGMYSFLTSLMYIPLSNIHLRNIKILFIIYFNMLFNDIKFDNTIIQTMKLKDLFQFQPLCPDNLLQKFSSVFNSKLPPQQEKNCIKYSSLTDYKDPIYLTPEQINYITKIKEIIKNGKSKLKIINPK